MVLGAFYKQASHTNLRNKSVRVSKGEDALYPEEDEDDE
jgi:hypothetical protein